MTVTLDAAAKSADITLSNGNLTATCTGSSGPTTITRATIAPTGKRYLEWFFSTGGTGECGPGLCNVSASAGSWLGDTSDSIGYYNDTSVYFNYSSTLSPLTNLMGFSAIDVMAMCWDTTAGLVWWKNLTTASNWNNSGPANPATGVGGITIGVTGSLYPAVTTSAVGNACTINFGQQTLVGTIPSGFSAVDPVVGGGMLRFGDPLMTANMKPLIGGMRG